MVNYKNGKIYKIISNQTDKIYIGSTAKKYLCDRLYKHRSHFRYYQNGISQCNLSSFELLKYQDHHIVLIETYPCNSKGELNAREQYYMNIYKDIVVNKQKAFTGLTRDEYNFFYRNENKESIKEYKKKYYNENKEKINEKINCPCGGIYSAYNNKSRHHKAKIHKNWIIKNKTIEDKINNAINTIFENFRLIENMN